MQTETHHLADVECLIDACAELCPVEWDSLPYEQPKVLLTYDPKLRSLGINRLVVTHAQLEASIAFRVNDARQRLHAVAHAARLGGRPSDSEWQQLRLRSAGVLQRTRVDAEHTASFEMRQAFEHMIDRLTMCQGVVVLVCRALVVIKRAVGADTLLSELDRRALQRRLSNGSATRTTSEVQRAQRRV